MKQLAQLAEFSDIYTPLANQMVTSLNSTETNVSVRFNQRATETNVLHLKEEVMQFKFKLKFKFLI